MLAANIVTKSICAAIAALSFGAFYALGRFVIGHGEPAALIVWERAIVGQGTLAAWWLTNLCYPYALIPIAVVLSILAWRLPQWRARILFSIVALLLCWRGADLFQHLFARPRRLDWVLKHETSFSYPSSHAAISTGFYALWGLMIVASELPRSVRIAAGAALIGLAAAICWSRLALGAHYVTDLAGGVLLAVAIVAVGLAALPIKILGTAQTLE